MNETLGFHGVLNFKKTLGSVSNSGGEDSTPTHPRNVTGVPKGDMNEGVLEVNRNITDFPNFTRVVSGSIDLGNITGALDYSSLRIGIVSDDVTLIQRVSYEVLLPIMIVLGLVVNIFGIFLLTRRKLRSRPANSYYLMLISCDLLILVISIPTAITVNGCRLFSYSVAVYFAHIFFTFFYIIQTFTLYVILWISYDRFLALWFFKRFHEVQGRRVLRSRVLLTMSLCILMHMKHLFDVQFMCVKSSEIVKEPDEWCEGGVWIIKDDLHSLSRKNVWTHLWWVLRGLVVLVVPIILVLVFNVGIVVGLVHRRLHNTAATTRTRGQAYSSIYISLAISATFVLCTVPITVHATFYAENIVNCTGPYSEEVFRAVANLLLIGEHLTHFLFFSFNETFRSELKTYLMAGRHRVLSAFSQSCFSQRKKSTVSPATSCPSQYPGGPPQLIISPPEGSAETNSKDPREAPIHSNIPLRNMSLSDLDHPTKPSIRHSDQGPPSRSSVNTIEEVL
ncbi:probable G-protein coupled receptor B0563.6 [Cherax quadricarinatus]|uniref:probable G-protein coupled receptor B0563.6 n=1 Tax=Cherax quadricarinatus TaxID=27406 RepID=UPI00387E5B25